jgi:hypothetical protein
MKLNRFARCIALAVPFLSPLAHAGVVTFTAAGSFVNGSTLDGFVSIDTATGLISGADLAISGIAAHFTILNLQVTWPPAGPFLTEFQFSNAQASDNLLSFLFPPSSLVGFAGGILCGTSNDPSCFDGTLHYVSSFATKLPDNTIPGNSFVQLVSGSLTLAPVPEPSTIALFLTSLAIAAGGSVRRVRTSLTRRQQPATGVSRTTRNEERRLRNVHLEIRPSAN